MTHRTCAATMAALILVACQPDSQVPALPALDSPSVAEAANDSLRLTLEVPARVRVGEMIPIVLHATNVSDRTLELYLEGREPTVDVIVRTSSNTVVWRRLAGVAVPAILRLESLPADSALTLRAEWDQRGDDGAPVVPGMYQVTARVLAEDADALRFPGTWVEIVP